MVVTLQRMRLAEAVDAQDMWRVRCEESVLDCVKGDRVEDVIEPAHGES